MIDKSLPLIIEVARVQGHCPVHRMGDCFTIRKGHQLEAEQPVCMRALQNISPYFIPLSRGLSPIELGLSGYQGAAVFQCSDPNCTAAGCGVTFRITHDERRINRNKPFEGRLAVRW